MGEYLRLFAALLLLELSETAQDIWQKLAAKQGPSVCAIEHVPDKDWYFPKPWTGGRLCGSESIVRFVCCNGYAEVRGERGCPLVKPLKNIVETLSEEGAGEFLRYAEESGLLPLLTNRGPFTVFAAKNLAFQRLSAEEDKALDASKQSSRPSLLLFTVAEGKISSAELPDSLSTLYREGDLIVARFQNGLTLVNCIPLVSTDLEATNGVIHMTESLLFPTRSTTVGDIVTRTPILSTMAAAIAKAQMENELRNMSPFTTFVPVNEAWEALPQTFVATLMADAAALKALLYNHMVDSVWCSSAFGGENKLKTMEGSSVRIWCNESSKFVNNARILESDIVAVNGFVHHIDKVLIPDKAHSLAELLELKGLTYFLELATVGGLLPVLERPGTYSVFAPVDEAFEELSNDTISNLLSESSVARSIIGYHIASRKQVTSNFIDGQNLPTLRGQNPALRIKLHRKRITVEASRLTVTNIEARNGILHILDQVMAPPVLTVLEILQEGNFSIFLNILNHTKPNLLQLLQNESSTFTVFAPDDEAMKSAPPGMVSRLLTDPPLLHKMAAHHIVPEFLPGHGLQPGLMYEYKTVNGLSLTLRKEDSHYITVANLATITVPDLTATNGIVHKVSRFIEL